MKICYLFIALLHFIVYCDLAFFYYLLPPATESHLINSIIVSEYFILVDAIAFKSCYS